MFCSCSLPSQISYGLRLRSLYSPATDGSSIPEYGRFDFCSNHFFLIISTTVFKKIFKYSIIMIFDSFTDHFLINQFPFCLFFLNLLLMNLLQKTLNRFSEKYLKQCFRNLLCWYNLSLLFQVVELIKIGSWFLPVKEIRIIFFFKNWLST